MHLFFKKSLQMAKVGFLLVALFASVKSYAQPTVTLTKVDPTCPGNGEITVNATNTSGTVLYMLAAPSPVELGPQTSNHFTGLPPGNYVVHVYDNNANETPVQATITLTSSYRAFRVLSVTAGNNVTGSCVDDGTISISATDGKTPYSYEIESGPVTRPEQGGSQFQNLPTGTYTVRIKDACGASIAAQVNVNSYYNLQGREITSVLGSLYATYDECNGTVNVYTSGNNLNLRDQNSQSIPYNYSNGLSYRIEYPAGSGRFSEWKTGSASTSLTLPISAENTTGTTYGRIEVKHPCTNVVTISGNLGIAKLTPQLLSVSQYTVYDICNSYAYIRAYTSNSQVFCSPNRLVITEVGNAANTATFTNFSSTSYASYIYNTNDPSASAQAYKFPFEWNKSYEISYYNSANTLVNSRTVTFGSKPSSSISFSAYNSHYDCRWDTYTFNWSVSGNVSATTIKITVLEGPSHLGEEFTYTSSSGVLGSYKDFLAGNYRFKFEFGNGCPDQYYDFSRPQTTIGGKLVYADFVAGNFCGNFNLKMKWTYLDMNGIPINHPNGISDNDWRVYVNGVYQGYGDGGYEKIFTNFPSGTHRIEVYPWSANKGSAIECKVVDTTIVVPDYTVPVFNIGQSGGAVCSGSTGSIHVELSSGLAPFQYQIKPKGTPDSNYSVLQTSPDFDNLTPGSYIVRVVDGCGGTMEQEMLLISTAGGSAINASGASSNDKVCLGGAVTIMLKPIGPVSSVTWTKPDGTQTTNRFIVITNFQPSDAGTYSVEILSGAGCTISSSLEVGLAPQVNLVVTDPPAGYTVDITTAAVTAGSSPSGLTLEYFTDAACTIPVTTPTAIAVSGTYYIKATSPDDCVAVEPVNVVIIRNLILSVVGSSSIDEGEMVTLKVATEGDINVPSAINIGLTYASSTTPTPNVVYAPAGAATNVTIQPGNSSATFTMTANTDLLVEGLEVITVTAVPGGGFTMQPGADVVSVDVADKTPGDVVVEALNNGEEDGSNDGVFRIRFAEPNVTSTTNTRVTIQVEGEAVNGGDYTSIPTTHTIQRGNHFVDITIEPVDNFIVEGNRNVKVTIIGVSSI